jgi:hypothetical protein
MPNERYVKISMRDRWEQVPLDTNGDPAFEVLTYALSGIPRGVKPSIVDVFSETEIVNLVNRALYGMKYQRETHANRRRKSKEETA